MTEVIVFEGRDASAVFAHLGVPQTELSNYEFASEEVYEMYLDEDEDILLSWEADSLEEFKADFDPEDYSDGYVPRIWRDHPPLEILNNALKL